MLLKPTLNQKKGFVNFFFVLKHSNFLGPFLTLFTIAPSIISLITSQLQSVVHRGIHQEISAVINYNEERTSKTVAKCIARFWLCFRTDQLRTPRRMPEAFTICRHQIRSVHKLTPCVLKADFLTAEALSSSKKYCWLCITFWWSFPNSYLKFAIECFSRKISSTTCLPIIVNKYFLIFCVPVMYL